MAKVTTGLTGSIDGFFADEHGRIERLYPDLADLRETSYMRELIAHTGAVIMGRRAFEMGPEVRIGTSGTTSSRCRSSSSPIGRRRECRSRTST
jgi:hypothetical protein